MALLSTAADATDYKQTSEMETMKESCDVDDVHTLLKLEQLDSLIE